MESLEVVNDEQHDTTQLQSEASFLQRLSNNVNSGIANALRRWSVIVSKRPYTVIVVTTIFALIWGFAFLAQFEQERDAEDLFTPTNAKSFDDFRYIEEVYGDTTDRARIITIRNKEQTDHGNCRTKLLLSDATTARETIQAYYKMYEDVQDFRVIYEGHPIGLGDICVRSSENSPCQLTSILDLWDYNATVINAEDFNPLEEIEKEGTLFNRFGVPMEFETVVGKNQDLNCEEESGRASNVEAFAMIITYIYEQEEKDGAEIDPETDEWIDGMVDHVRRISRATALDSYLASERAVESASSEALDDDIRLLSVGYVLILVYTNVVLYKNSCLACKMHLSVASLFGIVFAILSAFGIVTTFGQKVNSIVQVLPFLILGLGIDDTFVLIGAYQRIDRYLPVQERIARTLEMAGSSIFVTSATDFGAFLMGTYTRLPAIRAFSAYAAVSILFDFLYQVTFFVAFLVLESRREDRYLSGSQKLGLACCCTNENQNDTTKVLKAAPETQEMCASETQKKRTSQTNDVEAPGTGQSVPASMSGKKQKAWNKMCGAGVYDPENASFSRKLVGSYLPSVTLHPLGRFGVLAAECGLLVWAIYGCTKVTTEFNFIDWVTPKGSSLETAFSLTNQYFDGDQQFFSVYTKEAERDYFYHQDELRALKTALDEDPFVVAPVRTWYEGFSNWLQNESSYADQLVNGSAPDASSFNTWLREYLEGDGRVYDQLLIFTNGSNPRVLASKIDASSVDIVGGEQSVDLLDSIRKSIETAAPSLDPIAFTRAFFFYDGYKVIAWETIRNVLLAGLGVFLMNVVVLANVFMASIVVGMVALTDLVVVGYMWYVDQYFNPVTAINLVLVVGIAVDYSAHIAHSFLMIPGDHLSRAKGALDRIGGEVLSGAFTTWLGIVVLGFAEHYFFESFFRMFFAIIVTGAWHGLVLLPVVLSFVAPKPYMRKSEGQ